MNSLKMPAVWLPGRQPIANEPASSCIIFSIFRALLLTAMMSVSIGTRAQDLEPRSYTNIPIGQTLMVVAGARSEGDV